VTVGIEGVDYSWGRPDVRELFRLGKRFIIRYVSFDRTGKNLSKAEADAAIAAGLAVVTNWEWDARDQLGGRARGVEHAREADRLHRAAGGPAGRPIYFSTDFDATTTQLATCYAYLEGAASVLGWARVGCYGSRRTVDFMAARGVRWLWQTYAWSGFSPLSGRFDPANSRWHPKANIHQYNNGVRVADADTDLCRAMTVDFGQWGQEDNDMPTADEIAAAVAERLKIHVDGGVWAGQGTGRLAHGDYGIAVGARNGWAYGKVNLAETKAARAELKALLAAVAGQDVAEVVEAELERAAARERAERAAELAELAGTLGTVLTEELRTAAADLPEQAAQAVAGIVDGAVARALSRTSFTVAPESV
jgi:hypothetical protein